MNKRDIFPMLFGLIVSTILAATLVIAGLKAGITPGVSPLVILFAWAAFSGRIARGEGSRFLNIAQVAGSAGMAVTAGVIFTAPLVQILHKNLGLDVPPVDVVTLIIMSIAGSLIGFGFVGLATRKFLTDPTLPAPEARACETMIETAALDPHSEHRPRLGRSLVAGLVASFMAPLIAYAGLATQHVIVWKRSVTGSSGSRDFTFDLPFTPIYIGIGGLLTLATALLVFLGSFFRLAGDFFLTTIEPGSVAAASWPANSMRWVGGGAMTVAVAYSLIKFVSNRRASLTTEDGGSTDHEWTLEIDRGRRTVLISSILIGFAVLLGWLFYTDGVSEFSLAMGGTIFIMCMLMVTLGAILSLQVGSSASPVSGTIFVTTLVLCLVAVALGRQSINDVYVLTAMIVAACVAVCAANDSSQDYKTMQLCGVRVQDGFPAQIIGLIAGSIVVPLALYIAHEAYTLGSPDLPAPQGEMFATLTEGLLINSAVPWTPILVGAILGAIAVMIEIIGDRTGKVLPAMALAVGIYLPAYLGTGILIGAAFRWAAERGRKQRSESILAAAGLITGAAALDLILGIAIIGGFELDSLLIFKDIPEEIKIVVATCGIAVLGMILYRNSLPSERGS